MIIMGKTASLRAAFQVLEEKQARWQDLLAHPDRATIARLRPPRPRGMPDRGLRRLPCLKAATEELMRLSGRADLFDRYDTAVAAIRRPA